MENAAAAPPTLLRKRLRLIPASASAVVSGSLPTSVDAWALGAPSPSPRACITRQVSLGPSLRARTRLILSPTHARTLFPLTSNSVGAQGASPSSAFWRHACTSGSRRLRTESLPPRRRSTRPARSAQVEQPASKPSTSSPRDLGPGPFVVSSTIVRFLSALVGPVSAL